MRGKPKRPFFVLDSNSCFQIIEEHKSLKKLGETNFGVM